jgi:hypothetical protein
MQWIPSDDHKRRDEAFADFIGGVAYEEDRGWSKEVWNAAWSARRDEAVAEKQEPVAMRYDFDGYGYKYIDNGSGSDWQTRIKDAEPVFAHPQPKQEPVAWATREDFYRELDRSVSRMRQQMEIKAVLMRCKNYDLALPIIDIREGYVLVGQVTQSKREWVGLTDDKELWEMWVESPSDVLRFAHAIEAKLREKNT